MIASISIFCRKRTTGASSTSLASCASAGWLVTSSVTSNSKSPEDSDSIASLVLAPVVSSNLVSLSCSTMTHSGESWVANLIRSAASWSVGSAPPMNRRLPRLPSTTTWYCDASFVSMTFLGSLVASIAVRSSSGNASAVDSVCARSAAETEPVPMTDATKLARFSRAERTSSSAVLGLSLPAWTSTLATPERAE